jgi:hypothetical protein
MATSGREPGPVEQDAATPPVDGARHGATHDVHDVLGAPVDSDDTEITLVDRDVAVVRGDGIEIVVDEPDGYPALDFDDYDPDVLAATAAVPARRAGLPRWARPVLAGLGVLALLGGLALFVSLFRDESGATDVATDPVDETVPTVTTAPTATTAPPVTTTPVTTAPALGTPPPGAPGDTTPATSPPATQPSTPPATHDPLDYRGLSWSVQPGAIVVRTGKPAGVTISAENTSTWTMRIYTGWCPEITGDVLPVVCTVQTVPRDLPAGETFTQQVTVHATDSGTASGTPLPPDDYTVRLGAWEIPMTVTG